MNEAGIWTRRGIITTPTGAYVPTSDNLTEELQKAATFARLGNFRVLISGAYVDSASELQTNSIAALLDGIEVEGVEGDVCVANVSREDKAA